MPRPLRRLIRELHRQREETRQLLCRLLRELQQLREETRRQREEVRQLRAGGRRSFIRELANFALTIFGSLISGLLLHRWLERDLIDDGVRDAGITPRDVRVRGGLDHAVRAGGVQFSFSAEVVAGDGDRHV